MQDYKIMCQRCGAILGYSDVPSPQNLPTKCTECEDGYITVQKVYKAEAEPADFDIFITNKRTGLSKHMGFTMSAEEMADPTRDAFIRKSTQSFVDMLSTVNINELCEQK